jgi:PAS domain S-box-containing protein
MTDLGSTQSNAPTHVVGIGASAGGLNALESLFDRLPVDTNMAFVVIQHLSPHFKSLMDDLLARHTSMPIHMATDGLQVEANTVYLIPPNTQMAMQGNRLHVSERNHGQMLDLPVDIFFNSLAEAMKSSAIAIVLSGTGTDGSRGVKAVRREGGLVLVQAPESAQFDGMPRSAIAAGVCDCMCTPGEMAEFLAEYAKDPRGTRDKILLRMNGDLEASEFRDIFKQLQQGFEIDFSRYKLTTVARRIRRRMEFHQIKDVPEYTSFLVVNADELQALYHDLLIGVTEFFRDPDCFDYLAQEVLPAVIREIRPDEDLRIWSAGCATGEEAYSLAIVATEAAEAVGFRGRIAVFATDVHRASLEAASAGSYDGHRLANVSRERLARHFKQEGEDRFKVSSELRKMVVFAPHNLASDAPFTKLDLVCCRNLLIYFQPDLQDRAISLFHFALRQNGILFLGSSEAPGAHACAFESVDSSRKIFRKACDKSVPVDLIAAPASRTLRVILPGPQNNSKSVSIDRQLLHDYDSILARLMPGVIIDENRQVLHYCGDISRFLSPPRGRPGKDLLDLVEGDLHIALCTALPRAEKTGASVSIRNVRLRRDTEEFFMNLTVDPIWDTRNRTNHYHVHFSEVRPAIPLPDAITDPNGEFDSGTHYEQIVGDLKNELRSIKENLQTAIEELQTSNEQLQATNEELLASNEELQSTNEELHSVNEELYTVNTEFERKNNDLRQLDLDHEHLLASIQVGIIFLDKHLRIRKFNRYVGTCFKLLPQDIGRPLDHIAYHLEDSRRVLNDVEEVLRTGEVVENEVLTPDGTTLLKRVLPFHNQDGATEGVVLTFTDVTRLKAAELALGRLNAALAQEVDQQTRELRASEQRFRTLFETMHEGFALHQLIRDERGDPVDYRFLEVNRAFARLVGRPAEQILGRTMGEVFPDRRPLWLERVRRVAETGEPCHFEEDVKELGRYLEVAVFSPRREEFAAVFLDASARHRFQEEQLKLQKLESLGVLAGGIAHDFNNIFTAVIGNLSLAKAVDGLTPRTQRLLQSTLEGCERASTLSRQLLTFARGGDPVKTVLSPRKILEESLSMVACGSATRWQWNIAPEIHQIEADGGQMAQVFSNILLNAVQAMPTGGTVRVEAQNVILRLDNELSLPPGAFVKVSFIDEGCGIPAENLDKIFDPYFTTKHSGSGLGLASVHSIVKRHGGHISVSSTVGKGTAFSVYLPAAQAVSAETAFVAFATPRGQAGKARILVLEDEVPIRMLVEEIICDLGYDVDTVGTGEDAVSLYRVALEQGKCYDAVVLDLTVPGGMGGKATAKELLKLDRDAQLIVSSGYSTDPIISNFQEHGFCAAITKPYRFDEFVRVLTEVLARREEAQENCAGL